MCLIAPYVKKSGIEESASAIIDANINSNKFNNICYIQAKLKMFYWMLLMKLIFYCWIPQELDVMIWSFKKINKINPRKILLISCSLKILQLICLNYLLLDTKFKK